MSQKTNWALTREGICYSIRLSEGETTIGRFNKCTIPTNSLFCSRLHCTIFLDEAGSIILKDTSSNGTFINDQKIVNDQISLKANDRIGIGVHNLTPEELLNENEYHVYKLENINCAESGTTRNKKLKSVNQVKRKISSDIRKENIINPYNKIITRSYVLKHRNKSI